MKDVVHLSLKGKKKFVNKILTHFKDKVKKKTRKIKLKSMSLPNKMPVFKMIMLN